MSNKNREFANPTHLLSQRVALENTRSFGPPIPFKFAIIYERPLTSKYSQFVVQGIVLTKCILISRKINSKNNQGI